jgi:hypothetical protein
MQKIIAELSGNCQYIVTDMRNSFLICFGMSCASKSFVFAKNWKLGVVFEFGNSLEVASMSCFVVATGVKLLENGRIKIVVLVEQLTFYCNMGEIILISNKKRVAFTFPGRCLFIYLYINKYYINKITIYLIT